MYPLLLSGGIVVVDSQTSRVFVIDEDSGDLLHWFECGDYVVEPSDVTVHNDEYYICDFKVSTIAVCVNLVKYQ